MITHRVFIDIDIDPAAEGTRANQNEGRDRTEHCWVAVNLITSNRNSYRFSPYEKMKWSVQTLDLVLIVLRGVCNTRNCKQIWPIIRHAYINCIIVSNKRKAQFLDFQDDPDTFIQLERQLHSRVIRTIILNFAGQNPRMTFVRPKLFCQQMSGSSQYTCHAALA